MKGRATAIARAVKTGVRNSHGVAHLANEIQMPLPMCMRLIELASLGIGQRKSKNEVVDIILQ